MSTKSYTGIPRHRAFQQRHSKLWSGGSQVLRRQGSDQFQIILVRSLEMQQLCVAPVTQPNSGNRPADYTPQTVLFLILSIYPLLFANTPTIRTVWRVVNINRKQLCYGYSKAERSLFMIVFGLLPQHERNTPFPYSFMYFENKSCCVEFSPLYKCL